MINVSIGIPCYNEGLNIKKLILALLGQRGDNFYLKEILIWSDGSTDNTVAEVRSVNDVRVKVSESAERRGKMAGFNSLADLQTGDVFIQFDADIKITDDMLLEKVVNGYTSAASPELVCVNHKPLEPRNYVEKLALFAATTWERAVGALGDRAGRYQCFGHGRLFSAQFMKEFRYPQSLSLSEDVYSFYYAKSRAWNTLFVPDAVIYFRLPSTAFDYAKQIKRFIVSDMKMEEVFGANLVKEYETMNNSIKLRALLSNAAKSRPDIVLGFLVLQIYTRYFFNQVNNSRAGVWDIVRSTKEL